MDQHINNTIHDCFSESSSRVANMTMDVMIPDDTNLNRHKTKAEEDATKIVLVPSNGGEPVSNAYMTDLVGYETRKEEFTVKTAPVVNVNTTVISENGENKHECAKTDSKWDADTVKRLQNEKGNVKPVLVGGETDGGMKCDNRFAFSSKVKLEPGVDTASAENQSRASASVMYPAKTESELNLSTEIIKEEARMAVQGTQTVNFHLCADAGVTGGRWPNSTATESGPVGVLPNGYQPPTTLVQRSVPESVSVIPDIESYLSEDVTDHQGNSSVKRVQTVKFLQDVSGVATNSSERVAPVSNNVKKSLRKTFNDEYGNQTGLRNLCEVMSNVPAGVRSAVENEMDSQEKNLIPPQIMPHLPIDPDNACHIQSHTGLKRNVPAKMVQHMPAGKTNMTNDQVESSERKVTPSRMKSNIPTCTEVNDTFGKRHFPFEVTPNTSAARNADFQSIVQKFAQVRTAPGMASGIPDPSNHFMSNEIFKYPVKVESELDLSTSSAFGNEERNYWASKKAVEMFGGFFDGKMYANNVEGAKSVPFEYPSQDNNPLSNIFGAKRCAFGEFDPRFVRGAYAGKTLPPWVGSHSNTKIDENSVRANARQAIHILPREDEACTQTFNFINGMNARDKIRGYPSTEVSMSPIDPAGKPKSYRKPRKEKLEVKKELEFEIIPVNSVGERNLRSQMGVPLEIPDMPPEVVAELTDIAKVMKMSNKTAAELVREHGPRVKELWKACNAAFRKPGVRTKSNRRQEFKAWVMSAGEPGVFIAKTIARSIADYTRKRRQKIKQLAQAGDPEALEVFSRVLENRRRFIERRRALREAGGPVAMAMAQRARDRERKRRARKALLKSGNRCLDSV